MNYEISKLYVSHPMFNNLAILCVLVLVSALSVRRHSGSFLDIGQTDQLKGAAILLVIVGHLWIHVAGLTVIPLLGDYSVCMFLILSGFGLTASLTKETFSWENWVYRRFYRIMIPYWILTVCWLIADQLFLHRAYSWQEILSTIFGMNFSDALKGLDYARWYITLLLIWYVAFCFANTFLSRVASSLFLCIFGLVLVILQFLKLFPLGTSYQLIAFPIGVLLGQFHRPVTNWLSLRSHFKIVTVLTSVVFIISAFIFLGLKGSSSHNFLRFINYNTTALSYCSAFVMVVGLLGRCGYSSRFLESWGQVSYEAYLIHGPLLIKYNPVMSILSEDRFLLNTFILLAIIWFFSYLLHMAFRVKQPRTHETAENIFGVLRPRKNSVFDPSPRNWQ